MTYSQSGFMVHAVVANYIVDVSEGFTCSTPLVKACIFLLTADIGEG